MTIMKTLPYCSVQDIKWLVLVALTVREMALWFPQGLTIWPSRQSAG